MRLAKPLILLEQESLKQEFLEMRSSGSLPGILGQGRTTRMTTMNSLAGLDVSLSTTTICIVDAQGRPILEDVVATDPEVIAKTIAPHAPTLVALEAGPMSEWLHDGVTPQA